MFSSNIHDYAAYPEIVFWRDIVPWFLPALTVADEQGEVGEAQALAGTPQALRWFGSTPGKGGLGA